MRYTVNVLCPLFSSIALLALACADSAPTENATVTPSPPFVITTQNKPTVQVPRTLQISWQGGHDTDTVSWESSDQSVASVSASGLITAHFPGSITITAHRGNASATLTVTAAATRIDVSPASAVLERGGFQPLTPTVRDADGAELSGVPVSWTTDNANVATVDARTGLVTAIFQGTTTITAIGGNTRGYVLVSVTVAQLVFGSIGSIGNHACGLEAPTGLAFCWGDNHAGALGVGFDYDFVPAPVSGARHFSSLTVGDYATCGIESATALAYCWGYNGFGDLGDGTRITRWEPMAVAGGIRFSRISANGSHTCGVEALTGLAYCWGKQGLIGDGTLLQRWTPTVVGSASSRIRFSEISAGGDHTCGIEVETGIAYCWGNNTFGQIGDGTTTDRLVPTSVAGDTLHFSSISAGWTLSCGIESMSGFAYCWGSNKWGEVGDGTTQYRLAPTLVGSGSHRFSSISATGSDTACGLEAQTGLAYCWGYGWRGGDGTDTYRTEPTLVGGGANRFSSIVAAYSGGYGVDAQTGAGYRWDYWQMVPKPIFPVTSSALAPPD